MCQTLLETLYTISNPEIYYSMEVLFSHFEKTRKKNLRCYVSFPGPLQLARVFSLSTTIECLLDGMYHFI